MQQNFKLDDEAFKRLSAHLTELKIRFRRSISKQLLFAWLVKRYLTDEKAQQAFRIHLDED